MRSDSNKQRRVGEDLTVVSAFEAVGQLTSGKINEKRLIEVEKNCIPGAGSCGGMFTANTMSAVIEVLGLSLPHSSTMAAEDYEKELSAEKSAEILVNAIKKDIRPLDLMTKKSFENAISVIMAIGGSTNAVLHILAIANTAGIDINIEDFEKIRPAITRLLQTQMNNDNLSLRYGKSKSNSRRKPN